MNATSDFPPLVEAYLADLDRALAAADPRERAETVAAVREHAAESLARHGTDDESARRVLDELGPVETIAAEVSPAPVSPAGKIEARDVLLAVITVMLWPLAPITLVWSIIRLRSGVGNRILQWFTIALSGIITVTGIVLLVIHELSLLG